MKLTPERKEIHKAQEGKWSCGSSGAGRSFPYRVKRYLSKEFSDKIRTEVQAKCAEWIEKLDSIKPAKRFNHYHSWCAELDAQYCNFERDENAIPTKVCGHTVYVKILDSYRKGNGQMGIKAMERPNLFISSYYNSPRGGDWHTIGELLKFEICWDAESERYYVCDYYRAETPEIRITRKNWPRSRCRAKFMSEVKQLEEKLESEGVTIGKIVKYTGWYKRGLESYYVDCVNSEITA